MSGQCALTNLTYKAISEKTNDPIFLLKKTKFQKGRKAPGLIRRQIEKPFKLSVSDDMIYLNGCFFRCLLFGYQTDHRIAAFKVLRVYLFRCYAINTVFVIQLKNATPYPEN